MTCLVIQLVCHDLQLFPQCFIAEAVQQLLVSLCSSFAIPLSRSDESACDKAPNVVVPTYMQASQQFE